ncbi:aminotransferase class I/II-fold pyridoxal phosphate-dependent enzyme [Thalassotalea maritima]|uniref:aminotransferase class I/II-fold pyridoxal phosphate-dependent enzyme n=1 Tax=Thalassotalea maritima TaxID=3242416 RepID=UPI0035299912
MSYSFFNERLAATKQANRFRRPLQTDNNVGREIIINGQRYLNFSSNDYLGLASHPDIKNAFKQGIDEYGTGSGSASLISGYSKAHAYLQSQLSDWLGFGDTLLFSSGFAANTGTLQALGHKDSLYLLDKLSHASLIDGAFLSNAKSRRFLHNDPQSLDKYLQASSSIDNTIIVEGVYSMDGDKANISETYQLSRKHNAHLYIDDAHGIGVLANDGSGSLHAASIVNKRNVVQMVTFGKAIGTQGAAICAGDDVIEYLRNYCREYIYSTAIPAALARATSKSIEICQSEAWRREKLIILTTLFKLKLDTSIEVTQSDSAIIGVLCGSEADALACQQALFAKGIFVKAIRPPTVEPGKCRLRVTLTANHTEADVCTLALNINEVFGEIQNRATINGNDNGQ